MFAKAIPGPSSVPVNLAVRNTAKLIGNLSNETREYLLYCPLYDGLKELAIGINEGADIVAVERNEKPLVFYGTSITQGG